MRQPRKVLRVFLSPLFFKEFERMAGEAMDICLRVLEESNKSRFDSYSVRNSLLRISHITFRDCRVYIFSDNLSRNSCEPIAFSSSLCRHRRRSLTSPQRATWAQKKAAFVERWPLWGGWGVL